MRVTEHRTETAPLTPPPTSNSKYIQPRSLSKPLKVRKALSQWNWKSISTQVTSLCIAVLAGLQQVAADKPSATIDEDASLCFALSGDWTACELANGLLLELAKGYTVCNFLRTNSTVASAMQFAHDAQEGLLKTDPCDDSEICLNKGLLAGAIVITFFGTALLTVLATVGITYKCMKRRAQRSQMEQL